MESVTWPIPSHRAHISSCSTPSGIMESVTVERKLGGLAEKCSTPSGIMESVTIKGKRTYIVASMCSTPSGIMESVTRSPASTRRARGCAQRLPASWNRSLGTIPIFVFAEGCSTPSGIMESVTNAHPPRMLICGLCSTPSGIMESVTGVRAVTVDDVASVLNAFRHHGIGHLRCAWLRAFVQGGVLNAFRHHGIGHKNEQPPAPTSGACSTPSGIMESVTSS